MHSISRLVAHTACACAAAAIISGCSAGNTRQGYTPSGATASSAGTLAALSSGAPASTSSAVGIGGFTHYYVVDLGTLGGGASVANSINDRGWISGLSKVSGNASVHAVLWVNGQKHDLGTLGGLNSGIGWPVKNDRGEVAGISDVSQTDPLAENFCGFASINFCAGFLWRNGARTALPTLGGNNSFAAGVNNAGQTIGFAETAVRDSSCGAPQAFDYDAVIWEPKGNPHVLAPLAGDIVSQAVSINGAGSAAGASGACGPPNNLGYGTAHALLWPRGGSPVDLGNLGGSTANIATAVNNSGEVVGQSAVTGNTTYHAFRWNGSMSDLGTLPGDALSEALGLNDRKQIVGYSCDANGNCRGFIWQNGAISDLNLFVPRSQLYIVYAGDINDRGWIVGQAVDMSSGRAPAVLLIPASGAFERASSSKVTLPESVRRQLLAHRGFRNFLDGFANPH